MQIRQFVTHGVFAVAAMFFALPALGEDAAAPLQPARPILRSRRSS